MSSLLLLPIFFSLSSQILLSAFRVTVYLEEVIELHRVISICNQTIMLSRLKYLITPSVSDENTCRICYLHTCRGENPHAESDEP